MLRGRIHGPARVAAPAHNVNRSSFQLGLPRDRPTRPNECRHYVAYVARVALICVPAISLECGPRYVHYRIVIPISRPRELRLGLGTHGGRPFTSAFLAVLSRMILLRADSQDQAGSAVLYRFKRAIPVQRGWYPSTPFR